MKALHLALALLAAGAPLSCAPHRATGPYATPRDTDRDPLKAQRLTQEAASIMDRNDDRAESLLREALTADLYHGPAHNNLGVLYLKRGDLYRAASELEWAQKLMPGLPDPRMNLALVLERAGRTDQALAQYSTALEVYPDHLPTLQALARLQLRSGRADDRTRHALEEVALRGETQEWRDWAHGQLTRLRPGPGVAEEQLR
jgi:Flp pilus assembly protein TadD